MTLGLIILVIFALFAAGASMEIGNAFRRVLGEEGSRSLKYGVFLFLLMMMMGFAYMAQAFKLALARGT